MATLKNPVNIDAMPQGSIKVFIRDTLSTVKYQVWVMDDPAVEFAGETKDVDYSNYSNKKVTDGDYYNITYKQYELRPELMTILNKGLAETVEYDGVTAVAGQPDTFESGERGYDDAGSVQLKLTGMSSITSITWGTDGALTVTTDYIIVPQWDYTIIKFVSGWSITTLNQNMVAVYDATPVKGFYVKPYSTGMATGFVLETLRTGTKSDGTAQSILTTYDDCKPDQPVETYGADKDDKWAYLDLTVKGRKLDQQFIWFETV